MKFTFLPHTADIKFQSFGKTIEEAFTNAALAFTSILCKDKIKENLRREIIVNCTDLENLLHNYLEELIFLLDTENLIVARFAVQIQQQDNCYSLIATLFGDDSRKYSIHSYIKAITYHEMFVRKIDDQYVCQVVVDI